MQSDFERDCEREREKEREILKSSETKKLLHWQNAGQGNKRGRNICETNREIINSRHFLVKLLKTKHREENSQAVREKRSCHDNPKEVTSDS